MNRNAIKVLLNQLITSEMGGNIDWDLVNKVGLDYGFQIEDSIIDTQEDDV